MAEELSAQPSGLTRLRRTIAIALALAGIAWICDLPSRLGWNLYTEQFLAVVIGASLTLVYLRSPRPAALPPWRDRFAALAGAAAGVYLAIAYPSLLARQMAVPAEALIVSILVFALALEALRRVVGLALVLVVAGIVGYGLIGHLVPGPLQSRAVEPQRLFVYIGIDANGMLGITLTVAATIVLAFVLFGQILLRSGGGEFFNDLALGLMGRFRGGAAKIAIAASSLFGTISGVVVSNIVATGVLTIPLMKRSGYRPESAAAIEATASTGGQIMPPVMGVVAFLMTELLQVSYASVCIAALVPALLYYAALFIQADLEAARDGIAAIEREKIPPLARTLARGWPYTVPFAVVVVGLFTFGLRPETAGLYAAAAAAAIGLVFGYGGRRLRLRELPAVLGESAEGILDVVMIAVAAGFIIGTLNLTGLGFSLTYSLAAIGKASVVLMLVITAVLCIVLGMGMPTVGVYLLLAVLVAPSLVELGISPMAAHLFVFYLGMMSMVTPPVAIGSFFAASLAGADPMRTAIVSMRFGCAAYIVPFLFVFSPALLLAGDPSDIALSVVTALLGIGLVSVAAVGYLFAPISRLRRALFLVAGLFLLVPVDFGGRVTQLINLAGLATGCALVAHDLMRARAARGNHHASRGLERRGPAG